MRFVTAHASAAALFLSLFALPAMPQELAKPVRIVVGFPPGTTGDVIARIMAPRMAEGVGQPVTVENRPGAGSSLAAEAVVRSTPDGTTLLASTIANAINASLYALPFDFDRDLAPVSFLAETPGLLVAHPSAPAAMKDLIAAARAKPGALQYGSSGNGTVTHLWGELLALDSGATFTHVPYKGSSQILADILEGRLALMFTPASTVIAQVKAGKLRALGAIAAKRISLLPDVPTLAESGIAGFDSGLWFGLNAPAATPRTTISRLNAEVARVLSIAGVRESLAAQSIIAAPGSSDDFGAFVRRETQKWARVVKAAGVKAE